MLLVKLKIWKLLSLVSNGENNIMIKKTILFGIGNYGREDDALGWIFLDKIAKDLPDNYDVEYRYQMQVEDAEIAQNYDRVIFIDAHMGIFKKGYTWEKCVQKPSDSYTSHELNPETIMYLTNTIYNKQPKAYILGITGKSYELTIGLTNTAEENLTKALRFFKKKLLTLDKIKL